MKKKILIIEDEIALANNLKIFFDNSGFEAHCAYDGQNGVKMAKRLRPDLTICDIMLPDSDGYMVFLKLNKLYPAMPFIFLTAKGEKEDIRKGMLLGADDYISKPFDFDDLLQSVKKRLEKREQLISYVKLLTRNVNSLEQKDFILVEEKNAKIKLKTNDILFICYYHPYSELNAISGKKYYVKVTLKKLLDLLPKSFERISKKVIVNANHIDKLDRNPENSKYMLSFSKFEQSFLISKKYLKTLIQKLKK